MTLSLQNYEVGVDRQRLGDLGVGMIVPVFGDKDPDPEHLAKDASNGSIETVLLPADGSLHMDLIEKLLHYNPMEHTNSIEGRKCYGRGNISTGCPSDSLLHLFILPSLPVYVVSSSSLRMRLDLTFQTMVTTTVTQDIQ
ncbi:hypothetical protein D9757_005981 [Collybiopsis confluens]|uniref:Uncharacterized protein n=1 Tax=Collybiopsis confluens TaxID=2823264 RepID=A0A8H5CUS8_9AGAR|nr:hypothetical protein D9757_013829 [Collybiopsis confluens]KAF5389683.1 hypothetical protein D9757_005981 [Collybiopsis confluens]